LQGGGAFAPRLAVSPTQPAKQENRMIAFVIKGFHAASDTFLDIWHFTDAVVQDMRQTRKELEDQYGPLGF
jgi:hypothetical protein